MAAISVVMPSAWAAPEAIGIVGGGKAHIASRIS
jgi:hypothetical protein